MTMYQLKNQKTSVKSSHMPLFCRRCLHKDCFGFDWCICVECEKQMSNQYKHAWRAKITKYCEAVEKDNFKRATILKAELDSMTEARVKKVSIAIK